MYLVVTRPPAVPQHFVATPNGWFDPACVIEVGEGDRVLADGRTAHRDGSIARDALPCASPRYDLRGQIVGDPGATAASLESLEPAQQANWIETVDSTSLGALSYVHAQWTVPAAPATDSGQLIYFFPGLENRPATFILQPVLGWNQNEGPPGWSLASWNCCLDGTTHHSGYLTAVPGTTVAGDMTGTNCSPSGVCTDWTIVSRSALATVSLQATVNVKMDYLAGAVLEHYQLNTCDQLPASPSTTFSDFRFRLANGAAVAPPAWTLKTGGTPACDYRASTTASTATLAWDSSPPQTIAVATNQDGRLETVFARGGDPLLFHDWQLAAGGWNGSVGLDARAEAVAIARNGDTPDHDGRLEVVFVGTGEALHHDWQSTPGGPWAGATPLTGPNPVYEYARQIALDKNGDGRLELVYVGTNNALYHDWQMTPGGSWHGEAALGGFAKRVALAANKDHRLEVIYVGTNDALYRNWQISPGGDWHGEVSIGGAGKQIALGQNGDGRLELFYVGTNDALYHRSQITLGGDYSAELPLGGFAKRLAVATNSDGSLELIYIGTNDALYHKFQTSQTPSGWSAELAMGGAAKQIAIGQNVGGRLELIYLGTNNALYHNFQTSQTPSGWSGEAPL